MQARSPLPACDTTAPSLPSKRRRGFFVRRVVRAGAGLVVADKPIQGVADLFNRDTL
jgi:hypothetical protein